MNKLHLMVVLIALIGAISSESMHDKLLAPFLNGPTKELFKAYHSVYGKEYDLNTEEGVRRYRIFKDNLKYINEVNSQQDNFKLGLTPFADMTNEEYRQKVLRPEAEFMQDYLELSEQSSPFLSTNNFGYTPGAIKVDWTTKFPPVKSQGGCGSCWAFATYSSIEGNYNIKTGKTVVLGPQQLVDCDNSNGGCNGGWPSSAYDYAIRNGVALESDYRYTSGSTGVKTACSYQTAKGLKIVTAQKQCPMGNCPIDTWLAMLQQGPMQVIVDAGQRNFQLYKSGVADLSVCNNANHAVVAIGVQSDDKGDYIKILNSWSAGWGDKGYINVRYTAANNACHITRTGWLPIVQENPNPNPNPNPDPNPNPSPEPVPVNLPSFYTECNYQGSNVSTSKSIKNFKLGSAQDLTRRILSVKTFGYDVTIYSGVDCTSRGFPITTDDQCFTTSTNSNSKAAINNSVSATVLGPNDRPKDGCIHLYSDSCFTGTRQEICGDINDLNSYGFNDKTVSIAFGKKVSNVVVFIDANYSGLAFGLSSSNANLNQNVTSLFHNSISSIRIFKTAP